MDNVKMVLEKQTPGAIRFVEVDDNGTPKKQKDATIGTLYFRKSAFPDGQYPQAIVVSISVQA